jgi:hypothetical protein
MGIRFFIMGVCLTLFPLLLNASEHGIQLSLNKKLCAPGDVIELHAQMTRSDYAEFELKLPKVESLHLVTQEQSPISYSKGLYKQSAIWVFQPKHSGDIEWTGIRVMLKQGESEIEYTLPPLALKVIPYPTAEDSLNLEPLPDREEATIQARHPIWLYALCFIGALLILYSGLRLERRKKVPQT